MSDHSPVPQTRLRLIRPTPVLGLVCQGGPGRCLEVPFPYKPARSDHTRDQRHPWEVSVIAEGELRIPPHLSRNHKFEIFHLFLEKTHSLPVSLGWDTDRMRWFVATPSPVAEVRTVIGRKGWIQTGNITKHCPDFVPGLGSWPICRRRRVETQTRNRPVVSGLPVQVPSAKAVVRHVEHSSLVDGAGAVHDRPWCV